MITAMKTYDNRPYSMERLYRFLGISRQWYSQHALRQYDNTAKENQIVNHVKKWRKYHPKMGSRQMYFSLTNQGIDLEVGINKFETIVSKHHLGVGTAKRFRPLTSDGKGKGNYPNLTNGLILNDINCLIVGDITYFDIKGEWFYIFTLKDVYSQYLLSLVAANTLEELHAITALEECQIIRGTNAIKGCIHHSDNGSQYNGNAYKKRLSKLEMKISRADNCQQNGSAEQLNHIIKNMYLNHWSISSLRELKQACKELQYLNNHQRVISQLEQRTPVAFENYIQILNAAQRPINKMYDFSKS